jgi:outer membrane murein-binding lipoprotein Lpp
MDDTNFNSQYPEDRSARKLNGVGVFFLITTILFLGAGIFLFADNQHKAKMIVATKDEVSASASRYIDLDSKYTAALAEIESYKGKNAELDSVLAVKEKYLLTLRSNLNKEKKNRDISDAEYKRQMNDLNTLVTDLNNKVDQLSQENKKLATQKDSLGVDITQKASTISELQTTNTTLTKKVTVASLLIPTGITTDGVHTKSSGKESETSKASKTQSVKVCFNVPENKVADVGEKTFFVRIISPEGSVLAVQSQGSGVFTSVESGEQMQYTTTATVNYDQQPKQLCSNWSQTSPFPVGHYSTEIYQDGYLVGKSGFDLK